MTPFSGARRGAHSTKILSGLWGALACAENSLAIPDGEPDGKGES
jgi:hypothetical protein